MDREALIKRLERVQSSRHNQGRDIITTAGNMDYETLRKYVEEHERAASEAYKSGGGLMGGG